MGRGGAGLCTYCGWGTGRLWALTGAFLIAPHTFYKQGFTNWWDGKEGCDPSGLGFCVSLMVPDVPNLLSGEKISPDTRNINSRIYLPVIQNMDMMLCLNAQIRGRGRTKQPAF